MPGDGERDIPKAYIDLKSNGKARFDTGHLMDLLGAIFDYEDEKYKETGRGLGRKYTIKALVDLAAEPQWLQWLDRYDPNGLMCDRRSYRTSQGKLSIRASKKERVIYLIPRRGQQGLFASFADIHRLFRAFAHLHGEEWIIDMIRYST